MKVSVTDFGYLKVKFFGPALEAHHASDSRLLCRLTNTWCLGRCCSMARAIVLHVAIVGYVESVFLKGLFGLEIPAVF